RRQRGEPVARRIARQTDALGGLAGEVIVGDGKSRRCNDAGKPQRTHERIVHGLRQRGGRVPEVTRGFLPRSWTRVTSAKPAASKRSRTAAAWSKPCSTTSLPPGSRWSRAVAQIRS